MNFVSLEKYILNRTARNIYFWLLLTCFFYVGHGDKFYFYLILLLIVAGSFAIPCYINNTLLLPKLFIKRKYALFLVAFVILVAISTVVSFYFTRYFNLWFSGLDYMRGTKGEIPLIYHSFPILVMLIIMASAKFTYDAILNQRKLELLESQQVISELESLKSQVNPHFLFNSLNAIYGLARRNDHETAEAVIKLADILRYVLYECNESFISLSKEVTFLHSFMDFARLRNSSAEISFHADKNIRNESIAPLIFLPFIENAIKHGLEKHMQNSWLRVRIDINSEHLYFECSNSNHNKDKYTQKNSGGIGLKNVQRRLNLIYGSKHKLEINNGTEEFKVCLNLIL